MFCSNLYIFVWIRIEQFQPEYSFDLSVTKKTQIKSACTERQHVDYFSNCFKNRNLPLPDELKPGTMFYSGVCAVSPDIYESIPDFNEISEVMSKQFKLQKAAGSDGVFNELLEYSTDCPFFMEQLVLFVQQVWSPQCGRMKLFQMHGAKVLLL